MKEKVPGNNKFLSVSNCHFAAASALLESLFEPSQLMTLHLSLHYIAELGYISEKHSIAYAIIMHQYLVIVKLNSCSSLLKYLNSALIVLIQKQKE